MEILKKIGKICFVLLVAIALVVDGLFIYYHFFVKDFTTGTNYIGDQTGLDIINSNDLTVEEKNDYEKRWFIEANLFSNDKKNGIELQELKFNYFTDYRLTSEQYLSTGMQYIGDYKWESVNIKWSEEERDNYVFKEFNYYDTRDGISYSGQMGTNASVSTLLKRSTLFTVRIEDEAYALQLNKSYRKGFWIGNLNMFGSEHFYTWAELFESIMKAIKSNNKGYGDYYIPLLNLTDFFTVYKFDETGKKYQTNEITNYVSTYSVLKFHYDKNGARNSSQSMFGSINMDSKYDLEKEYNTEYWQERFVYNLTEKDLLFRQSEQYGGHLATLSAETKNKFDQMKRAKVNISINLNSEYLKNKNINVVGLDYLAFENFEIDTLTITGSCDNFHILSQSLKNTNLKTLKHSKSIILNIHEAAIDTEFSEVII